MDKNNDNKHDQQMDVEKRIHDKLKDPNLVSIGRPDKSQKKHLLDLGNHHTKNK
jgi:hypothetical protein